MASLCTHCGHDLSGAPRTGAAASRCPNCGAEQLVSSNPQPPARPPGGPPKPPPRRPPNPPPSPAVEQPPVANPFMGAPEPAADAAAANPFLGSAPEPAPQAAENPFLAPEPAPQPAPQASPQPISQPRVIPPATGAPLQAQPGAVVPSVKDPHAAFRRGSWKKPAMFAGIAAGIAAGLFYGLPQEAEESRAPGYASVSAEAPPAVIGASVSPEVIPDPTKPTLANPNPAAARPAPEEEAPAASPDRPDRSDGFAAAFKSASQ